MPKSAQRVGTLKVAPDTDKGYHTMDDYFTIDDCYDEEGNFDYDALEDAIMDGEYVPEDW